ncbi:uncharacterized protein LOC135215269 [Macrobrachium nipponense]|uniref:uncharacterized protein LOC135215269 n=1 Tax=Macrobrachium nipponense TaxID=159736 RepID=UPI0030C7EE5F
MTGKNACAVCQTEARQACGGCGGAFYCSKEHQRKHWPTHKQECQPFRVASSPEAGQYLVANRRLNAGQVILKDSPLAVGPLSKSQPQCLGCTAAIEDENFFKCPKCQWPLCSEQCSSSPQHKDECLLLSKDANGVGAPKTLEESSRYDFIMILRCLLTRSANPSGWQMLLDMASHAEQRKAKMGDLYKATIWYLTKVLDLDYDTDVLHQVYGAVVTNTLEIRSEKGARMRALYPRIRLLNHSCIPNTHLACHAQGVMEARTATVVESGEPFFICYTGTTMPFWERQSSLRDSYCFACVCARCEDPTEAGTHFSSLRCPECDEHYLVPFKQGEDIAWRCEKCTLEQSNLDVKAKVDEFLQQLEAESIFVGSSVDEQVTGALEKTEKLFHRNHYVWMKVAQYALWKMRNSNTQETLNLRRKIWTTLLPLYETFEPGLTKRRGMSLMETAKAFFDSAMNEVTSDGVTKTAQLQKAVNYYQEAANILGIEPAESMESTLALRARASKAEAEKMLAQIHSGNIRADGSRDRCREMGEVEICELCGAPDAQVSCPECDEVFYCSTSHQEDHWDEHKEECRPTVIEMKDPERGRYLVPGRDIKAGELLFKEEPIALGPRASSRPVCLGCHKSIEDMYFTRCPKCLWPLCSPSCASSKLHVDECPILANDKGKVGQPADVSETPRYDCIFVLRCLLLRDTNPKAWRRLLTMASHAVQLEADEEPYHMATITYIKDVLKAKFQPKLIHHARGAIMTNCFEWRNPSGVSLRGMYPKLGRINHSCYPNVTVTSDSDGAMYARAAVDIKAGKPLYITYTGITLPIWERQAYTNAVHYFTCDCKRCTDPTELGLHYSSPKCETCGNQYLEPKTWLWDTIWECPLCHGIVQDILVKMEYSQWLSRFDCHDTFITAYPKGVQNILEKVEYTFHGTHHVWTMAAQVAIRTLQDNNSRESLTLRIKLWERLLKIYSALEPGLTLRRGTTLYEIGICQAILTQVEMDEGRLTDHFYGVYMKKALGYLHEAIDILSLQPPTSHERRWYKKAVEKVEVISLQLKKFDSEERKISSLVLQENQNPLGKVI